MSNNRVTFGTGRRCISPQVPSNLAGYFNIRMWDKVLDDLFVHALVIKQNGIASAVVYFDLLNINTKLSNRIYQELTKSKILSKENVILCASHTHTAPAIFEDWECNPEYCHFVIRKAVEAIMDACANIQEGDLYFGETMLEGLAFNRRFWMKDGSVVTNPGKLNPHIDRVEGPVDNSIPMLGIKQEGKLKILLANISNHGDTIGGTAVSSDWMGICRSQLEAEMGPDSMFMPLIAPAGNINHFDVSKPGTQCSYDEAQRIGKAYAEAISASISNLITGDETLTVANNIVRVNSRTVDATDLNDARLVVNRYHGLHANSSGMNITAEDLANKSPIALKFFADAVIKRANEKIDCEFNLVCIDFGPLCILSMPSEIFVEIGMEIREKIFPDKTVMIATHSGTGAETIGNGYIPNKFNFGRGGYETTYQAAPFDTNTADHLIAGVKKLKSKMLKK